MCSVSLATEVYEVYVVVSVQSCLLDLIALIMARASFLSWVRGTKCLVRGPWYCPEPPALVVVDLAISRQEEFIWGLLCLGLRVGRKPFLFLLLSVT